MTGGVSIINENNIYINENNVVYIICNICKISTRAGEGAVAERRELAAQLYIK